MSNRFILQHWAYPPLAFPVDGHSLEVTLKVHGLKVKDVYVHHGDRYNQGESVVPMKSMGQDFDFQYFRAVIPSQTRRIRYLFRVVFTPEKRSGSSRAEKVNSQLTRGDWSSGTDLNTLWFGESGTSSRKDHIRPFQFPYICEKDIYSPPSWLDQVTVYQIFPERFFNGNPSNDPPGVRPWSDEPLAASGHNIFYGGDLEGVTEKLDYIKELGAELLYLTPLFTSPSSHKYDVTDYEHVDPRFGGDQALKRLSAELHRRGMKLMLDVPLNHCGRGFFAFKDVMIKGESSPYRDWFFIRDFPVLTDDRRNYETFAEVSQMPKLNTSNPELKRYLLGVIARWTREFQVDGWRLDVANEVDHSFWRDFRKTVLSVNPDAFILGEIWHDALPWLQGDQFDSVLNYPWRDLVLSFFIERRLKPTEFAMALTSLLMRYPWSVNTRLVNFLGSHDTPRIMTLAGRDVRLVELMVVFLFVFPGIPLIYYGDEVGMEGGTDPDCRRPMIWNTCEQNLRLFELYRAMVSLRKAYPWLSRGSCETILADDETGVCALKRSSEDGKVNLFAAFNPTDREVTCTVPSSGAGSSSCLTTLSLPRKSYRLWVCGKD